MIRIQNIKKSFGNNYAIKDLSLEINTGEIFGLLGQNGAGKSTTINLLLGFLKPDAGKIIFNDDKNNNEQTIGYIPENVNLYPYLSGIENLDYFCKLASLKYSNKELNKFLIECGLQEEFFKNKVETYSKGMRQKVGIAIAYAKKAKIYLLDEPASGLDPSANNELSALLKKLASDGATILMASHDIFRIKETCHKVGILRNGELVKLINSDDVTSNELESIYLKSMHL